jgi:hypothetical protein
LLQRVVDRIGAKTIRHFSATSTLQGNAVFRPSILEPLFKNNRMG